MARCANLIARSALLSLVFFSASKCRPLCTTPQHAVSFSVVRPHTKIFSDTIYNKMHKDRIIDRFILLPQHKLAFCYIEKVGCSQFNKLFNSLSCKASNYWLANAANYAYNLTVGDIENILLDPTWHKAVFYRDPIERFVSAFQSKCLPGKDSDGVKHCKPDFGHAGRPAFKDMIDTLDRIDRKQSYELQSSDIHFERMARSCGGLDTSLHYYNTVDLLSRETANKKIKIMFKKVNGLNNLTLSQIDRFFPPPHTAVAFDNHNTNAKETLKELLARNASFGRSLFRHYAIDYAIFDLPLPRFGH